MTDPAVRIDNVDGGPGSVTVRRSAPRFCRVRAQVRVCGLVLIREGGRELR